MGPLIWGGMRSALMSTVVNKEPVCEVSLGRPNTVSLAGVARLTLTLSDDSEANNTKTKQVQLKCLGKQPPVES